MASTRSRRYTDEEWDKHRDLIKNMYPREDITLKVIADFLRRHHGFDATERQYKRKIHDWGLEKKVKGKEMLQIVQAMNHHFSAGRNGTFFVRKKRVDEKKIRRWIKRTGHVQQPFMTSHIMSSHQGPSATNELVIDPQDVNTKTNLARNAMSQDITFTMNITINYDLGDVEEIERFADCLETFSNEYGDVQANDAINISHNPLPTSTYNTQNPLQTSHLLEVLRLGSFESQKMLIQSGLAEFSWDHVIDFERLWSSIGISQFISSKYPIRDLLAFEKTNTHQSDLEICLKTELLQLERQLCENWPAIYTTLHKLGSLFIESSRYVTAVQYQYLAFAYARKLEGDTSTNTLASLCHIARMLVLKEQHFSISDTLSMMVRERAQKILSPNSRTMLSIDIKSAECLQSNSKYEEAFRINAQALSISRMVLDPDDQISLHLTGNLAILLCSTNKIEESEKLLRELILFYSSKRDSEHRLERCSYSAYLVYCLIGQNKHLEAEQICRDILSQQTEVLSLENIRRRDIRRHLACCLGMRGEFNESEEILRDIIEKDTAMVGKLYNETILAKESLYFVLAVQMKLNEARGLAHDVLESWKKFVGPDHPMTHRWRVNIGKMYHRQFMLAEALEYYEVAYEGLRRHHGETFAATEECYMHLSNARLLKQREADKKNYKEDI